MSFEIEKYLNSIDELMKTRNSYPDLKKEHYQYIRNVIRLVRWLRIQEENERIK